MLRSVKELYGEKLGASDGDIGQIKDFYFDVQNWTIRYLVADTDKWLPGRQVLISPYSLSGLNVPGKVMRVNLTRRQIEDSPSIESQKPVSRQYEEELYRCYGWPSYWKGEGLWGASDFPVLKRPLKLLPIKPAMIGPQLERESHLHSAQAVKGYLLWMAGETIGHICDYMMDEQNWQISQLVVKTGHRLSGKDILFETKQVLRISYEESMVFAQLAGQAGEKSPTEPLTTVAALD